VNRSARVAAGLETPPVAYTSSELVEADAAIETDHELWAKFGSDSGTLDYLASLAAAVTAIDERDLSVRLRFSYVRLWPTAADPWSATAPDQQLAEVRTYWTNPANGMDAIAGPHDLVHFISGKAVQGGIAYIGSVCDPRYFFGVSQVFGHFNLSDPTQVWDVLLVTHEIGHNLGTPHTHCYSPPVDECYDQEANCCAGPVVCSRGTIMSYCHLNCGGLPDIDLVFGDVVSAEIRSTVATASCLKPATCGNGVLDSGEQCDGGDLGGATCASLGYASGTLACDANCTFDTSQCVAGPCGDGIVGHGEACDPGGIGGASPSFGGATCASVGYSAGGSLTCAPNCSAIITGPHCSLTATQRCSSAATCPSGETCVSGATSAATASSTRASSATTATPCPGTAAPPAAASRRAGSCAPGRRSGSAAWCRSSTARPGATGSRSGRSSPSRAPSARSPRPRPA
jgi:Metallo-peptidase family M12